MKNYYQIPILIIFLAISSCQPDNKTNTDRIESKQELVLNVKETEEVVSASLQQLQKAKEIIAMVSKEEMKKVDAQNIYKRLCTACHGIKGNMMVNGAKDLKLSGISLEERVAQVYFGRGLMTPYKGLLTETEIVAVCHFVETLRN